MRTGRQQCRHVLERRRFGTRCGCAWAASVALTLLATGLAAFAGGGVLIVNSDASVSKYIVAQKAFEDVVGEQANEVDLAAAGTDMDRLRTLITSRDPNLIYCVGSRAYLAVHGMHKERKIVMSSAINCQRFPVGSKTYGVANELSAGMQLTMFRYFFPSVTRVGVLYSKRFNSEWLAQAKKEAKDTEVEIVSQPLRRPRDLEKALSKLLDGVDAIWLIPDPVVLADAKSVRRLFEQCDSHNKPIFAYNAAFAVQGAVMALSPDVPTIGRQAAGLAKALLANESIGERFEQPAGSEIVVNLRSVRKYGLSLNEDALDSVNRIIK